MKRALRSFVLLWLFVFCAASQVLATQSLTLSSPSGPVYALETSHFKVTGDKLTRVTLKVYRLTGSSPNDKSLRKQVIQQTLNSAQPRSNMTFSMKVPAAGWYQAEASGGSATSFDEITFSASKRPIPGKPVPSLNLSGPEEVNPPGNTTFGANGTLLKNAVLRAWQLLPGGAQQSVFEQNKLLPPRPQDRNKPYDPTIRWSVPLKTPGVYLLEAKSNTGLKRLKYVRVSDIGVVTKRAPHQMLVYAVRLSTGLPLPKAAIRLDDKGVQETRYRKDDTPYQVWIRKPGPSRALTTQADGVAIFEDTPDDGIIAVSASAPDGSRTYNHETSVQNGSASDVKVLFYTERPVYRPGQTVYFKGVARRDLSLSGQRGPNGALFVPLPNARVDIEFTDAANDKFETLRLQTDGHGDFAGKVQLREQGAVGRYAVEMKITPAGAKESESFYNRFSVQEYRKPEYEVTITPQLDEPYAVQGKDVPVIISARYFFGGPVKGATLKYSGDASGEIKLDDNGEAKITLSNPTDKNNPSDRTLTLNAQVIDDANRIVESNASIFAPYTLVRPTLKFDKSVYDLQENAKILVRTVDPIGRAVSANVRVQLFFTRKTRVKNRETLRTYESSEEVSFFDQNVTTDQFGVATLSARLGRGGYIHAQATARDVNNRVQTFDSNIWVLSKEQTYWGNYNFPALEVVLDKTSYAPGETVRALITTSKERATALLTLQGDRIFMHKVLLLDGRVTLYEFKFPDSAAPGAYLVAGLPDGRRWVTDSAYIKAIAPAQMLNVQVKTAKNEYRPGTTAQYTVEVRDGLGKLQIADVSLGVVDKAIYGLANDETPEPIEFFYGSREDLVATSWEFPGEIAGGAYQRIEKAVPIRRNFQDTAYWNPFVRTNAQGVATLNVDLPDNLTTWRATARAFTDDTKAGATTSEVLVTKPLLTRLILPRFVTQSDHVQAQVIVQNNTNQTQNLRVSLRGEGIQTASVGEEIKGAQSGTVAPNGSASFNWTIGAEDYPVGGVAKLTATARTDEDASSENSDAQQLPLPILPRGVAVNSWQAGIVKDATSTWSMKLPQNFVHDASKLEISLSPSIAGPMIAALPNLIQYPYGCTEQTLSRFVPALAAARALQKLKLPPPAIADELPKIVERGRSTLYSYQHQDGGWGWWPDDDTDAYLTAYAVYGLSLAKEAGYEIERERIIRGTKAIQAHFGDKDVDADGRAFMMLAYATAIQVWNLDRAKELGEKEDYLGAVYEFRAKLSNYGLASLALAYARLADVGTSGQKMQLLTGDAARDYILKTHQSGESPYYLSANGRLYYRDPKTKQAIWVDIPARGVLAPSNQADAKRVVDANAKARLNELLDLLETRARRENGRSGPVASWQAGENEGSGWNDSDIEATAIALQVLARARPDSNLIQPTVAWLLQSRRGVQWQSTKDTAQVVIALADYLAQSKELAPDETVQVWVNGQMQREIKFTAADIGKADARVVVDGLNEDAQIEIRRVGNGVVYYSSKLTSYDVDGLKAPADNGFKIERHYQVQNEKGWWRDVSGPIANGTLVRVDLRVTIDTPREYILLEDFVPSGFEARPEDDAKANILEEHADCILDKMVVTDPPPGWSQLPVDAP